MVEKFYKIGEVSKLLDLPASTLRYWENQFRQLRPVKSTGGQRFYTEKHIETLTLLKEMLYNERYTIEGAKQRLKELYGKKDTGNIKSNEINHNNSIHNNKTMDIDEIKNELKEILKLLQ